MTVILPPNCPNPLGGTLTPTFAVAAVRSPYTGSQQTYKWPGDYWTCQWTLPTMGENAAAKWRSFFLKLEGRHNTFRYRAPSFGIKNTTAADTTITAAFASARDKSVAINLPVGDTLPEGSIVQIGDYLHMLTEEAIGDGVAVTINFQPGLRMNYSGGTTVTLQKPVGLWRLSVNAPPFEVDYARFHRFILQAEEAL